MDNKRKIPRMNFEERNQLITYLDDINGWHLEVSECAIDISENFADHFAEGKYFIVLILGAKASRVGSDYSSVNPPSDVSIYEGLFGCKSDCTSISSTSSNISM